MLAPLMQGDVDQDPLTRLVNNAEPVCADDAVLEFHAGRQPAGEVFTYRPIYIGEVGLQHPVPGMSQAMRELAVIGQEDQAFSFIIKPADMEEPLAVVGHQVCDRLSSPVV